MKKKISKKELLREVVRQLVRKELNEASIPSVNDDKEIHEDYLPIEYVRQMIRHADKYTSRKVKYHIWKETCNDEFKSSNDLVKELKEFIDPTKHEDFMLFAEVLKKRFNVK